MNRYARQPRITAVAALCATLALSGCVPAPVSSTPDPSASQPPTAAPETGAPPQGTSSPTPESTPAPDTELLHPVTRVVDGDTIYADIDGQRVGIRIIGLDTPETVHPSQPVGCYGPEASAAAKARLEGQHVRLIEDPTQGKLDPETGLRTDYYDRALFYVELADGTDFALSMIQDGLGEEYTYRGDEYQRAPAYRDAEALARETGAGLWGSC